MTIAVKEKFFLHRSCSAVVTYVTTTIMITIIAIPLEIIPLEITLTSVLVTFKSD